jgi:hypothetical protein
LSQDGARKFISIIQNQVAMGCTLFLLASSYFGVDKHGMERIEWIFGKSRQRPLELEGKLFPTHGD